MKTRKLLFTLLLMTIIISACKKEDKFGTSISPIQNLTNTFSSFGYFRDEPTIMSTLFKSTKDGRITELGIRAGKGTYTVSLWDSSALSLISSTTITASDSTVFLYKDISDINIVSNKSYIISVFNVIAEGNTGTHVYITGITGFPFTLGDINVLGSYYKNTTNASAFPASSFFYTYLINGIADFKFEPKL